MKLAYLLPALLFTACNPYAKRTILTADYNANEVPAAPSYEEDRNWAVLPWTLDDADAVASGTSLPDQQQTATADVFFIYPTIYTDKPGDRFLWNASVEDVKLNARIDKSTIRQQASIFNAAGRIYSPRYRQAHISTYYTEDEGIARAAFDTAYADVKRAFEYYLSKHNDGRPIIIAAHSQGTTHGKRLVREFFDGKALSNQLVAAYLVGIGIPHDYFVEIPVCDNASATGCVMTWRTWQRPAAPWTEGNDSFGESGNPPYGLVVNPLTWETSTTAVSAAQNKGGTLRKFKLIEGVSNAQINQGILWIDEPNFFGSLLIKMENWHVADYNLFYENVRLNAVQRVEAFQKAN